MDSTMQRMALAGLLSLAEKFRVSPGNLNGGAGGYISEVLDYINRNYQQKLSAAELAKRFYVSEQKLCADFKAFMNETLHHYLRQYRTIRGLRLNRTSACVFSVRVALQLVVTKNP